MIRILVISCMLCGLAAGGCTGNSREAPASGDLKEDAPKVDPMVFILLHRAQIESILSKHQGEKPDCEAALAELLRFIADHKEAFLKQVKDKPATWQPEGTESSGQIQLLMEYSESCPEQVVRLNQAIRSLIP